MNQIFNNRELALGILLSLFILFGLSNSEIRNAFLLVLKAFLKINILTIFTLFTCYVAVSIYILQEVKLWDYSQLKNSLMWYFSVGIGTFFGVVKAKNNNKYFSTLFNQQFKVIAFIGFVVALHSYNLFLELFLISFTTVLVVISVYAEYHPEYLRVKKLSDQLLAIIGVALISHSLYIVYSNPEKHLQLVTFQNFLVPLFLTVMLIPLLFCLSKFMAYEVGFHKVRIYTDSSKLRRYAMFKSFIAFKGDIAPIQNWLSYSCIPEFESKNTIRASIEKYIEQNK